MGSRKWDRRRENKRRGHRVKSSETLLCSIPVPLYPKFVPEEYEHSYDTFYKSALKSLALGLVIPKEMLGSPLTPNDVKLVGGFVMPDGSEVRGDLEEILKDPSALKEKPAVGFFWGDRIALGRGKT